MSILGFTDEFSFSNFKELKALHLDSNFEDKFHTFPLSL